MSFLSVGPKPLRSSSFRMSVDDVDLDSSARSTDPLFVASLVAGLSPGDDAGRFVDGELLSVAKSLGVGCWFRIESKGFDSSCESLGAWPLRSACDWRGIGRFCVDGIVPGCDAGSDRSGPLEPANPGCAEPGGFAPDGAFVRGVTLLELEGCLFAFERSVFINCSDNSLAWRISSGLESALEISSGGIASRLSAVRPSGRLPPYCFMASLSDWTSASESRDGIASLEERLFRTKSRRLDKSLAWLSG